jgi:hypothetical protein
MWMIYEKVGYSIFQYFHCRQNQNHTQGKVIIEGRESKKREEMLSKLFQNGKWEI